MNKIYRPLDPGIKDAVMLLRKANVNTSGSCDGDHDGASKLPWISVEISHQAHFSTIRWAIVGTLLKAGHHGFTIEEHFLYQRSSEPWKVNIIITFWNKELGKEP